MPIQREHAKSFAEKHNIEIIHEEADEGKTGLLADRPGFNSLFQNWIKNTLAPQFDYILVYDVSRWGRFQDQNEGAYYEFLCKERGKKVVYVSRGFPKEEQLLISHLQTSIERYMAAEYSRQLSSKVFYGCVKVSRDGYSAGGTPCYGMTRLLLDSNKEPIRVLKKGEHKQIANERVTFIPTNDKTTKVVKEIFRLFTDEEKNIPDIVNILNEKAIRSANGGKWNKDKIVKILSNEVYTGTRIYNKTWNRLRQGKRNNPRSEWVIRPQSFPSVIDQEVFKMAQERLYWSSSGDWKSGILSIRRARYLIRSELSTLLLNNNFLEDDIPRVLEKIPILISIASSESQNHQWCFLIPEAMRVYDYLIGVSIKQNNTKIIDRFFKVPTKDFGVGGVVVFSEKDSQYSNYKIDSQNLEGEFLKLARNNLKKIRTELTTHKNSTAQN